MTIIVGSSRDRSIYTHHKSSVLQVQRQENGGRENAQKACPKGKYEDRFQTACPNITISSSFLSLNLSCPGVCISTSVFWLCVTDGGRSIPKMDSSSLSSPPYSSRNLLVTGRPCSSSPSLTVVVPPKLTESLTSPCRGRPPGHLRPTCPPIRRVFSKK